MIQYFGENIIWKRTLESTNSFLSEFLLERDLADGTIVVCENQTSGKGVSGAWNSDANMNLTFSILLYPTFLKVEEQTYLNFWISHCVEIWVNKYLIEKAVIKWPNDILVKDEKICGILIENAVKGKKISRSIIGIGLNVNQLIFPDFSRNATSLKQQTNTDFELKDLLFDFCQILNQEYYLLQLKGGGFYKEMYLKNLYRLNVPALFGINGESVNGTILGVDPFGRLEVKIGDEIVCFQMKEIKFL